MMERVARVEVPDLEAARAAAPEVWRDVRRYDPPAQAALFAAQAVMKQAAVPSATALVAVAPSQVGSPRPRSCSESNH